MVDIPNSFFRLVDTPGGTELRVTKRWSDSNVPGSSLAAGFIVVSLVLSAIVLVLRMANLLALVFGPEVVNWVFFIGLIAGVAYFVSRHMKSIEPEETEPLTVRDGNLCQGERVLCAIDAVRAVRVR